MLSNIEGLNRTTFEILAGPKAEREEIPCQYDLLTEVERLFHCSDCYPPRPGDYENVSDEELIKGVVLLLDAIQIIAFRTIKVFQRHPGPPYFSDEEADAKNTVASLLQLEADVCSSPIEPLSRVSSSPVQYPDDSQSPQPTDSEIETGC